MKELLIVQSHPPHGTLYGQEGLDAALMASAFVTCRVLLLGDGIFQVLKGQDSAQLGTKNYSVTYQALRDYGVTEIYCSEADLARRGLETGDLLVDVMPLPDAAVGQLLRQHQVVLSF
ncbi:MAG: sulfurtransferase complex subunit TusC [Pseudomonadota bacterium]